MRQYVAVMFAMLMLGPSAASGQTLLIQNVHDPTYVRNMSALRAFKCVVWLPAKDKLMTYSVDTRKKFSAVSEAKVLRSRMMKNTVEQWDTGLGLTFSRKENCDARDLKFVDAWLGGSISFGESGVTSHRVLPELAYHESEEVRIGYLVSRLAHASLLPPCSKDFGCVAFHTEWAKMAGRKEAYSNTESIVRKVSNKSETELFIQASTAGSNGVEIAKIGGVAIRLILSGTSWFVQGLGQRIGISSGIYYVRAWPLDSVCQKHVEFTGLEIDVYELAPGVALSKNNESLNKLRLKSRNSKKCSLNSDSTSTSTRSVNTDEVVFLGKPNALVFITERSVASLLKVDKRLTANSRGRLLHVDYVVTPAFGKDVCGSCVQYRIIEVEGWDCSVQDPQTYRVKKSEMPLRVQTSVRCRPEKALGLDATLPSIKEMGVTVVVPGRFYKEVPSMGD